MMKRKCNLDLRLMTPSVISQSMEEKERLTIFYNGSVASCDATEFQARAIIYFASKEIEEKSSKWTGPKRSPHSPMYSPISSLSMKKSLQSFLEKRKSRAQSLSPYPITKYHSPAHHN